MEEVWKDIAFSNLPHELYPPANSLNRRATSEAPFSGLILQDYVPGAFGEPPQPLLPALLALRQDHSASLATQLNRTAEQPSASAIAGFDRRQKRIIKNRESAGRSRARKQASLRPLCFQKRLHERARDGDCSASQGERRPEEGAGGAKDGNGGSGDDSGADQREVEEARLQRPILRKTMGIPQVPFLFLQKKAD
ncbi:hypothetical protein KSP40_PGU005255 [Platanthera guangdongensis]|uniref:BZIP domain-containing protein n=1 Tax=Platanthera guangdongensis TaxID=2320717 RepID=A0ABR2LLM9_9ASPA